MEEREREEEEGPKLQQAVSAAWYARLAQGQTASLDPVL